MLAEQKEMWFVMTNASQSETGFNDMQRVFSGAAAEPDIAREALSNPGWSKIQPGFLFSRCRSGARLKPAGTAGRSISFSQTVVCLGPTKIKASAGHGIGSRLGAQRHRNTSPGCPPYLNAHNAHSEPPQVLILTGGKGGYARGLGMSNELN